MLRVDIPSRATHNITFLPPTLRGRGYSSVSGGTVLGRAHNVAGWTAVFGCAPSSSDWVMWRENWGHTEGGGCWVLF